MTTADSAGNTAGTIWTRGYVSLVAVVLLAYANYAALLPVIPLYVRHLGGTEFMAGVVLAAFSVSSFVLRPRLGRMVDAWDAGWVVLLGCVLLAATTVGMLAPAVVLVLLANVARGVGWAAVNTGTHVVLAWLAPLARRGEASGYYSLFMAAASVLGPPVALAWLNAGGSFPVVFLVCSACAAAAAVIARPLRRLRGGSRPAPRPPQPGRMANVIARSAVLPAVLVVLIMTTQPAVLGFVPLYADHSGIPAGGVTAFYLVTGACALLARALLGRLSDGLGRGVLILGGFLLTSVSLAGLAQVDTTGVLLAAGALYAVGQGMALPALTAVAIERAEQSRVGMAMATYSASYQVGLGAGGLLAGTLISAAGYGILYLTMAAVSAAGLGVIVWRWPDLRRVPRGAR